MSFKVLVDSFEKVQKFVSIANSSSFDIDLISGKNIYLDAKSIMGVLSCNIREPLTVIINCSDSAENDRLKTSFSPYIV